MIIIVSILISFLCGSIPTGYLLTKKVCGIDIRTKGSGNIGSTNVKRIAGTKISLMTQVVDILKGMIPVLIAMYVGTKVDLPINRDLYLCIVALSSILGHDYTPFLSFNGGKGVNTTLGSFAPIALIPVLIGVAFYAVIRKATGVVAIGSMVLSVAIPVACAMMKLSNQVIIFTAISSIILIYRHKKNIRELLQGKK